MRDISELIEEANRVIHTTNLVEITPDAVLQAVVALEIARSGGGVRGAARGANGLEYKPAKADDVRAFVDQYTDLNATATDIYRNTYSREPNAAEARSTAAALREIGLVSTRSNGRTLWRHA